MRSATAYTEELDELELACDELVSSVKEKLEFGASSIGIVFCDADVNVAELGGLLYERLGFDVVGVTTTASMDRKTGYHDMGIVLSVLTADDVSMVAGHTGNMNKDTFAPLIREAYNDALDRLGTSPDFIYMCAPYLLEITSDNYMYVLDELSENTPIFGGVATDHYDLKYQKTFYNGEELPGGMVFVLFSGNIRPVFGLHHEFFGTTSLSKGLVTQSHGHIVEKVGERTFMEYIAEVGSIPHDDAARFDYQSTPFAIELPDYNQAEEPLVRALCKIDVKTGTGSFLSNMPVGTALSMNVIQKDNLKGSCTAALASIKEQMRASPEYAYSMVFVSTCNGRHLLMNSTKDLETTILQECFAGLGEGLNSAGYYGFGEICPTLVSEDRKKAKNNFHNVSFAVCAI